MKFDIPFPIALLIIAIAALFVWKFFQRKIKLINAMPDIPDSIPANGHEVPVLATFTGSRSKQRFVSTSYNNMYPALKLYEDRIETTVILNRVIPLSSIQHADVMDTFLTRNLILYVKGKEQTVSANLFRRRNLAQVLNYLYRRKVTLSKEARLFMSKHLH